MGPQRLLSWLGALSLSPVDPACFWLSPAGEREGGCHRATGTEGVARDGDLLTAPFHAPEVSRWCSLSWVLVAVALPQVARAPFPVPEAYRSVLEQYVPRTGYGPAERDHVTWSARAASCCKLAAQSTLDVPALRRAVYVPRKAAAQPATSMDTVRSGFALRAYGKLQVSTTLPGPMRRSRRN